MRSASGDVADRAGAPERRAGFREGAQDITAEEKHSQDDDRSNRGNKQAVFDRGSAAFILPQTQD